MFLSGRNCYHGITFNVYLWNGVPTCWQFSSCVFYVLCVEFDAPPPSYEEAVQPPQRQENQNFRYRTSII